MTNPRVDLPRSEHPGLPAVSAGVSFGFDELPTLQTAWETLFLSRAHQPSASFEWTSALVRHHVRLDDRCFVVHLRRGDTTVGVVPLVARTLKVMGTPVTLLTPLSEQYNTHSDLLLESVDDGIAQAFVGAIQGLGVRWDCFRMARVLDDDPLLFALRRALVAKGLRHGLRNGLPAYTLDLPTSFDAYLSERSAKFRNHLKRCARKLHASGDVGVHELTRAEQFEEAYAALLQVERASWKQSYGTSITAVDHQTAFYGDLTRAAFATGRVHLHWLTLDARPVAYNLGYLTGAGYHYLKTSYDHAVRRLGPAAFLRAELVKSLIGRGVSHVDFPGEPYEWEAQWTDTFRWRTVLSVYPNTVRGSVLALVDRLRHRDRGRRVEHVDPRARS